jgi:excisionase family DNA binding protein
MELLTVEEAAEILGVSVATVRRRAASGELPARKSGKQWLIDGSQLRKVQHDRKRVASPPAADLPKALRHVEATDLTEPWVPDVLRFRDQISSPDEILAAAARRLTSEPPDPATEVDVAKTPFFSRSAVLLSLEDRVAYQAVVASVAPKIEALLPDQAYAARLSSNSRWFLEKGQVLWLNWKRDVRELVKSEYPWMIKSDLAAYFDHIPHRLLLDEVSALNPDPRLHDALGRMLSTWAIVPGMGIPQGPNASRVLGNFYMLPVDQAMLAQGMVYSRYQDDVRILGKSKAEVVAGMRLFEKECRKRGLIASPAKTELLHGEMAARDGLHEDREAANYFFNAGHTQQAKSRLRRILRSAIQDDGHVNTGSVKFSLWRLARLRDNYVLKVLFERMEDLAPVSSVVAAYLRYFITRPRVVNGISSFLADPSKTHSSFLVTWLFAAMLEHPGRLPAEWIDLTRTYLRDRNQPSYLRSVAACVVARGRQPVDVAWIKSELAREYDPAILRGYATALAWADALDDAAAQRLVRKSPALGRTVRYLQGRDTLPSLIYRDVAFQLR